MPCVSRCSLLPVNIRNRRKQLCCPQQRRSGFDGEIHLDQGLYP